MEQGRRPGVVEACIAWALFALVGVAILATYWRLPPAELYHTSGSGFPGGASRVLVFAGYSFGIVAIAIAWVAAARLGRSWAFLTATLTTALCATIAVPGVIDQADLDARPINALAGIGALLALALTIAAWRLQTGRSVPFHGTDWIRIAVAAALLFAASPWIAAELGFYVSDAPVLGRVFLAEQVRPSLGSEPSLHAVHLGHHHGLDGTLLALSALVLSRVPARMPTRRSAVLLAAYVSLMLAYGLANALQDEWNEQLVKRGTLDFKLPSVIRPGLTPAWAGIVVGAVVIYFAFFRVGRVNRSEGGIR
jgi:hypothetical protein